MIPFIFKEFIIPITNYPEEYVHQKYYLEDIINDIKLLTVGS